MIVAGVGLRVMAHGVSFRDVLARATAGRSEAMLALWQGRAGGSLFRITLSEAAHGAAFRDALARASAGRSEAMLCLWRRRPGGSLRRIALSERAPLGPLRGWGAACPIVQWSVTR